jgi:hypothetical protein
MIGTIERTNGGRSDFSAATEAKACHICQYTTLPSKIKGMPPSGSGRVSDALYNVSRRAQ